MIVLATWPGLEVHREAGQGGHRRERAALARYRRGRMVFPCKSIR
jgi:hypothetical protein